MSFISKVELKYTLKSLGIEILYGNYMRKKDIKKIFAKKTTELSESDFIAAVVRVAKDAKLHTPKNSYWECNNFSTAVVLCAKELSLDAELLSVPMKFQKDINDVEKGDTENHTYFRLGSRYYDFTLSQFLGSNKAYAIRTNPYPKSKHNPTKADPDGYTFWYDKIKNKLTASGVKSGVKVLSYVKITDY